MFWLARPPYLRWAAIVALVAVAVAIDLGNRRTVRAPFAAVDIVRGEAIEAASIRWRDVPVGLLSTASPQGAIALRDIAAGEPIAPSAVTSHLPPPEAWWTVELDVPDAATAGRRARVVVSEPDLASEAIIMSVAAGGRFGGGTSGLVAVPADVADQIARAATRGSVAVLLAP